MKWPEAQAFMPMMGASDFATAGGTTKLYKGSRIARLRYAVSGATR